MAAIFVIDFRLLKVFCFTEVSPISMQEKITIFICSLYPVLAVGVN